MFFELSQNPEMAAEAGVPISRTLPSEHRFRLVDKLLNAARRQMHSWSGTSLIEYPMIFALLHLSKRASHPPLRSSMISQSMYRTRST